MSKVFHLSVLSTVTDITGLIKLFFSSTKSVSILKMIKTDGTKFLHWGYNNDQETRSLSTEAG